ncbi:MAG: alpha/beta fold hydrolase [Rubrivivax sp.]
MQVVANGIAIEVDDQGPPDAQPLLLIMGLGMQLVAWPQALVQLLVARGFRVLRIDNRDTGLSAGFDDRGVPNLAWSALRYGLRLPVSSPYGLADMAADAVGVLDALNLRQAHVCGASLGGMVAQHIAAQHASRVCSLTLMMTGSGSRKVPGPSLRVQRALMSRPTAPGIDAAVAHLKALLKVIGSPAYPPDPQMLDKRLRLAVQRALRPAGVVRQLAAVAADGDRGVLLSRISAPTHIIHGQADVLIPVAAAVDLQARIAGATLDVVPGMGHDLPDALLPRFADGIKGNADRFAITARRRSA